MGNKNASCLRPQIEDSNFDTNSEFKIINNPEHKNRRMPKYEDIRSYSNKSFSFNSRNNFYNQKSPTYLDKVKTIQKYVRFCLSVKKFNEHIDLLSNILELDSTVNVIKDKKIANNLLKNNTGEQLSIQLINNKKINPYIYTRYYRININKYKPNRYLIKTPLTYIDKYKNNDLYEGTWTLEKKFHGYGIFYASGYKYEGFWNFGKLSGEARKFYPNKDYYIGNFEDGKSNGYGKYYHNDGTIYEGNWLDDQPDGKGKETFSDGSKFEGIFEHGSKKKGKFTWVDGSYYDGEIKKNYFEGYGKFKWKEGREYIGNWKNGKMHGQGTMIYIDGAKYEGEFSNGKREGKGNYYWNKNKYYKGNWVGGKQEGDGYYYNKGKGIIAIWKDGKMKQCISQEITQDLLYSKINEERPGSPMEKYSKTMSGKTEYFYDSINISTNLSNNSMRDTRLNKRLINNISSNRRSFKTDKKEKYQSSKDITNKKTLTDMSIISNSSINKSKITNIDVLFKNYSNSSRSKKSIISKNFDSTSKKSGGGRYCRRNNNKK